MRIRRNNVQFFPWLQRGSDEVHFRHGEKHAVLQIQVQRCRSAQELSHRAPGWACIVRQADACGEQDVRLLCCPKVWLEMTTTRLRTLELSLPARRGRSCSTHRAYRKLMNIIQHQSCGGYARSVRCPSVTRASNTCAKQRCHRWCSAKHVDWLRPCRPV